MKVYLLFIIALFCNIVLFLQGLDNDWHVIVKSLNLLAVIICILALQHEYRKLKH